MCSYFFNSKQLLNLFIGSMILFTSCQKVLPPIFKHDGFGNAHVFVAGYESNVTVNVAKCWIDGQEIKLSDGTNSAGANSIFVSHNDLYIAGSDNGDVYWKNNEEIRLSGSTANAIFVAGNKVYIAGTDDMGAVYWRDGTEVLLDAANIRGSNANSVFVSGNDIYVAGNDGSNAVYWKNGEEVFLTFDLAHGIAGFTKANSICVSGNDVHVVGTRIAAASPFPYEFLWKNGVLNTQQPYGNGNAVLVSGNDLYVAGMSESPTQVQNAAYWKNGEVVILSETRSFGTSIFMSGNDIYEAGYVYITNAANYAAYWKNGVEVKLTDGKNPAYATSIFVR